MYRKDEFLYILKLYVYIWVYFEHINMDLLPQSLAIEAIETRKVLRKLAMTRAALAELKGISATIPNEQILIDTLSLQEAKDSSAIENIVTTHDEIYQSNYNKSSFTSAAAKEVHRYAEALKSGFEKVRKKGFISINLLIDVQQIIEQNNAGIRKLPGTELRNEKTGDVVYTPPQDCDTIKNLIQNLEEFINNNAVFDTDPLIKMAIIHHRFGSIHPFYDGNGRSGRILNILYLKQQKLLDIPVLYLSKYIIVFRSEYYRLLQHVRNTGDWEPWILYILEAVEVTAKNTIEMIKNIKKLMATYKLRIRGEEPRIYSQDLINSIFRHPYTKITYLSKELHVSRVTATRYLDKLADMGMLKKIKKGRSSYYIHMPLFDLLSEPIKMPSGDQIVTVSSTKIAK